MTDHHPGPYILAIDQGTTSSRALIFDRAFAVVASAQQEFTQHFPADGWVEHDAMEIWQSVLDTCREALSHAAIAASQLAGLAITNQRETTVVWRRDTGQPIGPAIVWQDRRTQARCQAMRQQGLEADIQARTGLLLDPYFSATKIQWLLDNTPGARALADQGLLACGTIDCWLLWQLTDGAQHKTDATNASRTQLYNLETATWDAQLLHQFNVPASMLPTVCDNAGHFGASASHWLGAPVPVVAMVGDQQGALLGQACIAPGQAKCTYGTGAFLMVNAGTQPPRSQHRLLTTLAYRVNGVSHYASEGAIFIAGAAIQWLRDGLQLIDSAADCNALLTNYPHALSPVMMVPAFTGLGAPHWNPQARGALFGLTRDTGIADIVVGALQSIALQTHDLTEALRADGVQLSELRVDGGVTANRGFLQYLANILNRPVARPQQQEMTVLGAAYLAGLALGWLDSLADLAHLRGDLQRCEPQLAVQKREKLLRDWHKAVTATALYSEDPTPAL